MTTNREINYIFAPDGLAAIYEKKNGTGKMYYVSTDNLGSINMIADEQGNIVNDLSYDAWGRRRDPYTWQQLTVEQTKVLQPTLITDRGYTLHEHMDAFGLINMNGRAYDPLVGQFLSPDPFIQSTTSAQSYNRYSYCWNNPLKFVDPSGYLGDLSWADIEARNYAWGASYTNVNGQFYNTYWWDGYGERLEKWEQDESKGYALINAKVTYFNGAPALLATGKDYRTQIWAGCGYSNGKNSPIVRFDQPIITSESYDGELTGFYLEEEPEFVQTGRDYNQLGSIPSLFKVNNNESANSGLYIAELSAVMTMSDIKMYNKTSWYSLKQRKTYNQSFNGNGYTGGKIKHAGRISNGLKWGGRLIGAYNLRMIENQYNNGEITETQREWEHTTNIISTFGGIYGAAWGIGWEIGRSISQFEWYQDFKYDVWLPWREEHLGY